MSISKSPPLLGRVPPPISCQCTPLFHLQETLNLPALCRITGAEIKVETGGCHNYAKRNSQVDGVRSMEPWGTSEQPGGYDPANVNYGHADRDRRCAAVRWLYVVRVPRQEARNGGITSYNLKI